MSKRNEVSDTVVQHLAREFGTSPDHVRKVIREAQGANVQVDEGTNRIN